ncbi:MAG: 30S ribosome-binding factor RbfA [Anaerolinea sp.]|nr:30S ribosome-binding factor RbfA [Anaerolinea sp.]
MTQRTDRVDELLRQEIGQMLAREIADPRIGFATITDVETTPDLRHAKVWVSVIGTREEREAAVAALSHAMPYIRHELGVRLRIKRIPELHVRLDDTMERGTRVLRLLTELETGTDPTELAAAEAVLPTPVPRLPHEGDAPDPEPEAETAAAARPGPSPARAGRRAREARRRSSQDGGSRRERG